MSVLTRWEALPNRIFITLEYINSFGEKGVKRQDLKRQLQVNVRPPTHTEGGVVLEDIHYDAVVKANLTEIENMGFISKNQDESIVLNKEYFNEKSPKNLNEIVYPLLLKKLTDSKESKKFGQDELPDNIAFLLCMDPFKPLNWKGNEYNNEKSNQLKEKNEHLKKDLNDDRVKNLVLWANFLGFSTMIEKDYFIPDPTVALEMKLPLIFGQSKNLPVVDFIGNLGEQIPVMEGGNVHKGLQSNMKEGYVLGENQFAKSTSLALKRLEGRGKIKFNKKSDGTTGTIDLGRGNKELITHIEIH